MSGIFEDKYENEPGPKNFFRGVGKCFRCKTSKYRDEMVTEVLKTNKPNTKGGDVILVCPKCHKGGANG